ncbi:MAG: gliding motility-associated C-terminal domain-containing protein [Bacteroidales bacterium]|nr:gliding motility-associated C-terminal domain-containing protein [Bacteroidales bacterium]
MPEVFMPTGFVPNGLTKIYKPVGRLNGIEDYDFRIYDITGKLVFKSNNPEIGWDGNSASPSNYFYRISFKKGEQMFEKTGTVTVVK